MILRVITWIIVGAVIYRLLARYVFPIFHMSANTNDRLKDMQKQMHDINKKLNKNDRQRASKKDGDFIDYEEIR